MRGQDAGEPRLHDLRRRLRGGLEVALLDRPFGDVSVADIVAAAGTSKRSFYEVYPHKVACLLDEVEQFHEVWVADLERKVLSAPDRLAGARVAVTTFLEGVRENPNLARARILDIWALGPEAAEVRQAVKRRHAQVLQELAAVDDGMEKVELDIETALSMLGAIDAATLRLCVEPDEAAFERITESTVALVRAMFVGLWVESALGEVDLQRLSRRD